MKSRSSHTGKKNTLVFKRLEVLSGLFIICCRAKAFLQLGLRDNQHSFLSKPGLQNRPLSSEVHPTPSAPKAWEPSLPYLASASKKAKGAFKSRKAKISRLRDEGKDCDPLADGFV